MATTFGYTVFYGSATNHLEVGIWVGWLVGWSQHKFQNKQIVVRQGPELEWNWQTGTELGNRLDF